MSKTRLREDDRRAISDAILNHKFEPLSSVLDGEDVAVGRALYAHLYPRDVLKQISKLPKGALVTRSRISVVVDGCRYGVPLDGELPVFYVHDQYYGDKAKFSSGDAIGARIVKVAQDREDLKNQRRDARSTLDATLSQFRTFEDLIEAWPDAATFIKERALTRAVYASAVPAVQIADLSKVLDLPPVDLAA